MSVKYFITMVMLILANTNICAANVVMPGVDGTGMHGGTYWTTSNVREWLNSDKSVVGYTNNPPSKEYMGEHAYDKDCGFLYEFTNEEKDAIAIAERRIFVHPTTTPEAVEYGGSGHPHANYYGKGFLTNTPFFAFNYKTYANKKSNDKVFLLTPFETYWYITRRGKSFDKRVSDDVANKYRLPSGQASNWWLQGSTVHSGRDFAYYAKSDGTVSNTYASSRLGIVPAIYLKGDYRTSTGKYSRELSIGDKVEFGRYMKSTIEWEVINISDEGNPLLLAKKVLELRLYDAKGDGNKKESEYINFEKFDMSVYEDVEYKTTTGMTDIEIPILRVNNEDELYKRQNGEFILNISVWDVGGSGIDKVIAPDGNQIREPNFTYKFKENGEYLFKIYDKAGNCVEFMIPVGNVNREPEVMAIPSTQQWTNKDVNVDVKTSTDVRVKDTFKMNNTSEWMSGIFPNYTSYTEKEIRVKGTIEMLYCAPEGRHFSVGIGHSYKRKVRQDYTYQLSGVWSANRRYKYEDFVANNGKVDFDFTFKVPSDYSHEFRGFINTGLPMTLGRVAEFNFKNIEYTMVDTSGFEITEIRLPNGEIVKGEKNYVDTISQEGVVKNIYEVVDNRGKVTSVGVETKIDKKKPYITNQTSNVEYTNGNVDVLLELKDDMSGISKIESPSGVTNYNGEAKVEFKHEVSQNGRYKFYLYDMAGNKSEFVVDVTNIDKSKPTVNVVSDKKGWQKGKVVLELNGIDKESGIKEFRYRHKGESVWKKCEEELVISNEGIHEIEICVIDNVGNISETVNQTVKIDNSAPKANIFIASEQKDLGIVIDLMNITEAHSGIAYVEVSESADFTENSKRIPATMNDMRMVYNISFKQNPDEHFGERNIFVRVVDNVGNFKIEKKVVNIQPKGDPEINILSHSDNELVAKGSVLVRWKVDTSEMGHPNIKIKGNVLEVKNLETQDMQRYDIEGDKSECMIGLQEGIYELRLNGYITQSICGQSEVIRVRVERYMEAGNVLTKDIAPGRAIKYVQLESKIECEMKGEVKFILKWQDKDGKWKNIDVDMNTGRNDGKSNLIVLPIATTRIKVEMEMKGLSNGTVTPKVDDIVVYAK